MHGKNHSCQADGSASTYRLAPLRRELKPVRLHWFPCVRSTQDHAKQMWLQGRIDPPAVVLAGRQSAGRGRGSNRWWSARGCITATCVLKAQPDLPVHFLPLRIGLAVRDALADLTQSDAIGVKWPNDIVCQGRKLAGILCERSSGLDYVGWGLNVNRESHDLPADLRRRVTFLSTITNQPLNINQVLVSVCQYIHQETERRDAISRLRREYDRVHVLRGRRITVVDGKRKGPFQGHCLGIDEQGRLLVKAGGQTTRLLRGTVTRW